MMEAIVASHTDIGRIRANNEDSFLVDRDLELFIVCDGMGGHSAGEVASGMACEIIHREVKKSVKQRQKFLTTGRLTDIRAVAKMLGSAAQTASKEIYRRASKDSSVAGMGTTCTVLLLAGHNKGVMVHVGDSRLYVFRRGVGHQLSVDHTYVNKLVKRGAINKEQARHHPQGNVLSRALGVQPTVAIDTMIFDIDAGDTYMLCSDGLYNYFPDASELVPYFEREDSQKSLGDCIERALQRGGHDNATAVSVRISGLPPSSEQVAGAEQRIRILKQTALFAHLSYRELVQLLGMTRLTRVCEGENVITRGKEGEELCVVLAGEVSVHREDAPSMKLSAGSYFGEMALVDKAPYSATVTATNTVTLLVIGRDEFARLIGLEPVIATKLLWSLVQVMGGGLSEYRQKLHGVPAQPIEDTADFEIVVDD